MSDQIRSLLNREASLRQEIAAVEERLAALKRELQWVVRTGLPSVMLELGLEKLSTPQGESLRLTNDCDIAIPAEKRQRAMYWMEENGHPGLLRREVVGLMPDDETWEEGCSLLQDADAELVTRGVRMPAWQTLRAWGRDCDTKGIELPSDLFNFNPFQLVKVKRNAN